MDYGTGNREQGTVKGAIKSKIKKARAIKVQK
jgi:hypothetical protein